MSLLLKPFIGILINAVALYFLIDVVDGIAYSGGVKFFVIGGAVLGLINFFIKPLAKLISLPLVVLSGGLFLIVINAGILWFLSYLLDVAKFQDVFLSFESWQTYVIGAVVFGLINWTLSLFD